MKKTAAALSMALVLSAASAAFAQSAQYHAPAHATRSNVPVDSGYGPPQNWNEIEQSVPSGGN